MTQYSTIEEIFSSSRGGYVLLLGRVTNFTDSEIESLLEEKGMRYASSYSGQDVALVVLSSMLTPIEEEISYELYDMGVPDISLDSFEKYLSSHIKPNSLILSLKLSNDQERIERLLKNSSLSDELHLKLLTLYDWGGLGLYDSDANRDVTISFVKRFYRPDGFRDPAMVYAPTTVMNIAQDSRDGAVLDAILTMPNHQIKISQRGERRPKNLREVVALNESISKMGIKRLLAFNDRAIEYFLASNSQLDQTQQEQIYSRADSDIEMMLAHNSNLSKRLCKRLLEGDISTAKMALTFQKIDRERLDMVLSIGLDIETLSHIGDNISIGEGSIETLLELSIRELDFRLASNPSIEGRYLEEIYRRYGASVAPELSKNPNLPKQLIEEFYRGGDEVTIRALAGNSSTPKKILDEMCELNSRELNMVLASNPSVSLYHLQQFQLDPTLIMILAKNRSYGESVLNGLGI